MLYVCFAGRFGFPFVRARGLREDGLAAVTYGVTAAAAVFVLVPRYHF